MYDHTQCPTVKYHVLEALDRYAKHGCPTGGFLAAVLSNNLMEAVCRADSDNLATLFDICRYVYNEMPSLCHGSPERYEEWIKKHLVEELNNVPTND